MEEWGEGGGSTDDGNCGGDGALGGGESENNGLLDGDEQNGDKAVLASGEVGGERITEIDGDFLVLEQGENCR